MLFFSVLCDSRLSLDRPIDQLLLPQATLKSISPCQDPANGSFFLWLDILRGMSFPSSFDSVGLKVCWGHLSRHSRFRSPKVCFFCFFPVWCQDVWERMCLSSIP